MIADNTIHLVIATDAHHLILLATLLKSIEANHRSGEPVQLYLIEEGVGERNKRQIEEMLDARLFTITWLNMQEVVPAGMHLPFDLSTFPLITYMRLFIPDFMPAGVNKVLFMDADMLMLADISRLWHTDLGNYTIAAVQDMRASTFDNWWGGIKNYKALGFAPNTHYFNSGLLLMNIPVWKQQQVTQRVIETINNNKRFANYPDQYGLNVVLANQWLHLDERWNYFASHSEAQPFNIHFISRKPIYRSYKNNPAYRQLFYEYLAQTPWRNAKPIGELQRYLKKASNIWQKFRTAL